VTESAHADMVVCGRRGRGGVAEMLLGSTSHELSHHVRVPLVIVP
jgi:nucleotide-binding universal stress UspA family protein